MKNATLILRTHLFQGDFDKTVLEASKPNRVIDLDDLQNDEDWDRFLESLFEFEQIISL